MKKEKKEIKLGLANATYNDIIKCEEIFSLTFVKDNYSILNYENEKAVEIKQTKIKNCYFSLLLLLKISKMEKA